MLTRILCIIIKEFLQLRRDKHARLRLLVPPLVQMLVYGYAATFDVNRVQIALMDSDHSQESRDLLSRFTSTSRFTVVQILNNERELKSLIGHGGLPIEIKIELGFGRFIRDGQIAHLRLIVDGSDSNTAFLTVRYIDQIVARFNEDYVRDRLIRLIPSSAALAPQIDLEQRPWYNSDLSSQYFFVPGVIGSITLMLVMNLTAFSIVREREIGTLEQIMVSPISRFELIVGKTIPVFLIGLTNVLVVASVGVFWFEVPFRGSPLALMLGVTLFLCSTIGVGLLISTYCSTQQQAFASGFFFLSPAFTLSGFAFPIASMPHAMRILTYLDPLSYFLEILRGTFLKGTELPVLWPSMAALAMLSTVLFAVSAARLRKCIN